MAGGWEAWRDNLKCQGTVSNVAIVGLDGSVWTQTDKFDIKLGEINHVVNGFTNSSALCQSGITLGGTKYLFIQSDDQQIQGRKGQAGCTIAKAGKCVVIATYDDTMQPGNARQSVERLRDQLVAATY